MKLPPTNYLFLVGKVVLRAERCGCHVDSEDNIVSHCVYVDNINRPLVEAAMKYCSYSKQDDAIPNGRIYFIDEKYAEDDGIKHKIMLDLITSLRNNESFFVGYSNYSFDDYAKPITALPLIIEESKHTKKEYSAKFWTTLVTYLSQRESVPMNMFFDERMRCFGIVDYPNKSANCVYSGIEPDGYGPHQ